MKCKCLWTVLLCFFCCSCNFFQAKNIKDCTFSLNSISNVSVNNISFEGKRTLADFSQSELLSIYSGLKSDVPISFLAQLKIDNPNNQKAELSALEWILLIRDIEVATGVLDQKVKIDANETKVIPINVETNTSVLRKLSPQEIKTIVMNLSTSRGLPKNSTLKVKPAIKIGKKMLKTPNYFTIDVSN